MDIMVVPAAPGRLPGLAAGGAPGCRGTDRGKGYAGGARVRAAPGRGATGIRPWTCGPASPQADGRTLKNRAKPGLRQVLGAAP